MVPIDSIQAHSSVDIDDSCNNCCWGSRPTQPVMVDTRDNRSDSFHRRADHVAEVLEGHLEVTATEIRVFSSQEPVQRDDGYWVMTIEKTQVDNGLAVTPKNSNAQLLDARKKV